MDTVMSHITHLYHLSAPDFIDFTTGPVQMSPWLPSYTTSGLVAGGSVTGTALILNYVEALKIRRLCHTAGALFSGRQPIQNAMVPGGVTTHFDTTYPLAPAGPTQDQFGPFNATDTTTAFANILTTVRNFIDTKYIPNVLTVAGAFSTFWTQGQGCMNTLSYGDFHMNSTGSLLLKRGVASGTSTALGAFNQANIVEQVQYSYYDYGALDAINFPNGRHPYDGVTTPNAASANGYSWLKAPRYGTSATVYEVGPLARIFNSYLGNDTSLTVTSLNTIAGVLPAGGSYSIPSLVTNVVTNILTPAGLTPANLFSALGRHACRALEAKLLADACAVWNAAVAANAGATCYAYKKIPKTIVKGAGLAEAPRGALGHWIKIEGRKVAKYQCVVPSTWNFSPRDQNNVAGAVEQALESSDIGPDTDVQGQIVNILRVVHPFDCCIACAVHVVNPDGKEKFSFAIGPDGRPTNIKISE
jgi:hydrogenase large subunit